jgi:hypothetical protein
VGTGAGGNGAGRAPRRRRRTSACASCARGLPISRGRPRRRLAGRTPPRRHRPPCLASTPSRPAPTRGRATFARGLSLELSRVAVRTPRAASCARRAPHRHRLVGCGGEAHHDGRRGRSPRRRKHLRAARFSTETKSPREGSREIWTANRTVDANPGITDRENSLASAAARGPFGAGQLDRSRVARRLRQPGGD